MKLISLNIWGGRKFKGLMEYIQSKKDSTDIFCFQEVYSTSTNRKLVDNKFKANILELLEKELSEFKMYFVPSISNFSFTGSINFSLKWGIVIFVKKNIRVIESKSDYICGYVDSELNEKIPKPRKVQWIKIKKGKKEYALIHFHGLWVKGEKVDTKERLLQSQKIRKIIDKIRGRKIICGDFNLLPSTKSLSIIEKGLINLIKENNISTTRSKFYKKPDKYADYTIVSKDLDVSGFDVPHLKISDHLPMELFFD
jgi:endonuclease/exonuclease/phosphatase family metal-dependent hydrolase